MNIRTVFTILIGAVVLVAILNRAIAALNSHLEEHVQGEDVPS